METHLSKTVQLAREAGWKDLRDYDSEMRHDFLMGDTDSLKAFEALVRADERKEMQVESEADKVIIEYHEATIKRLEAAILAEREACAKEAENMNEAVLALLNVTSQPKAIAHKIRSRGNT
jgi:hypothetical protein